MTVFVLLRIKDHGEAETFLRDLAEYPDDPLLTPVQENTVYVTVESWDTVAS